MIALWVIPVIPLVGFALNGLLGTRLGKSFVSVVGVGSAGLATLAAYSPLLPHLGRRRPGDRALRQLDRGGLLVDRPLVPARPALGADAVIRDLRRPPDPRLLGRLHAPRRDRRRLRAVLRVPEPLPVRDAGP